MKYARIAKVLALVIALAFFVPTSISYIQGSEQGSQLNNAKYVRIYITGTNSQILDGLNIDVIESYDGFVLARVDDYQITALKNYRVNVEEDVGLFKIELNAATFDVREGEPTIPASLRIDSYPVNVKGYYLVHFIGPVKDEWKWRLEARGAEILGYVPNDAFLVRMTPEVRDLVDNHREVVWTGFYHPAYKIDPEFSNMNGIIPMEILTHGGTSITAVVADLNHKGYGMTESTGISPGVISYYQASDYGVIRARVDVSTIESIARLENVQYIEPYYEPKVTNYYAQVVHQTNLDPMDANARKIWDMGLRGQGQIVSIADTGLDFDHNMFRESDTEIVLGGGDIYNVTDYDRRKVIRYYIMSNYTNVDPMDDEWAWKDSSQWTGPCTSGHGTATSGILTGGDDGIGGSDYDGMAKEAQIFFQDIGSVRPTADCGGGLDDVLTYIPDDLNYLFGPPYAAGARVHSNSWGSDGSAYALSSKQIDEFMWKHPEFLVVFAEGNGGPQLGRVSQQPAAKNLLAAGGTFNWPSQNSMTTYSAWGPTADGRQRPTASFVSEGGTSWSDGDPWSNSMRDAEWMSFGGTSFAAPVGGGFAAIIRQYFEDGWYPTGSPLANNAHSPQASLVLAMYAASGEKMTGSRTNPAAENRFPNDAQGWGRPLLDNVFYFTGENRFLKVVDDKSGLKTGQWEEYEYRVTNSSQILKIVLAWTDYPGTVGASKSLVNDLDLFVTAPSGDTYRGNVWDIFSVGESRKNAGTFDRLNNMEGIIVNAPSVGVWKVRVTANDVPAGPQPYSITAVGGIDPGYGQVFLDKHTYTESDTVNITVVDIGASGSVTVNVTSDTEPWEEEVTLTETAAGTGIFEGSIQTSFGPPLANGIIEVSDRDTIYVLYHDFAPPHDATAHAIIDASWPTIYDVNVIGITSSTATVTWKTDVPADSWVYYDVSYPFSLMKSSPELVITHSITLVNLQTDTLYFFDVASSDGRGHRTLDDNGGTHYAFKTTAFGEILLVLGDETYEQKRPEGVLAYRQSLAAEGWSYNEWHNAYSGNPPLTLLQLYKAIIWQVGLEQYPPLDDVQMSLISTYLDEGGRMFFVHHDTHWAFCALTSAWFNLSKCAWASSTLKATYNSFNPNLGDPMLISGIVGETADPISGDYASGGPSYPTPYSPFRSGGSADEVTAVPAGGSTTYVWSDSGGDANPDKISVKWISSANNGTSGVGVWGGMRSRIVALFANWIDIDFSPGVTFNAKRTDILDKTIIWLLERDHPDVTVLTPNGGETITGDTVTITWTRATYGGTNINSQAAYYSADSGQSWFPIEYNIPAGNTTYNWTVTSVCNGPTYLVRVEVQDDGTPKFNSSDDSDGIFSINRPNGDCGGPLVWAGSVKVQPNPIMGPVLAFINATVDDRTRDNSDILTTRPAEFFFDTPGANGTGWGMNLTSPPTSPVEDVRWAGTLDFLSKICHKVFVHGQDINGYWGPYQNVTFCVQNLPPTRPPREPKNANAELINGANDVNITWILSASDPAELDYYEVWYSTNVYDPAKGPSYQYLGQAPKGQGYYIHSSVGLDTNTYFYFVKAVNAGGESSTANQAAKFARSLSAGTQLISVPVEVIDNRLTVVLQTLSYDSVRRYNPTDATNPWKSFKPGRLYNDFATVTAGVGLWIHLTSAGTFSVAGKVPQVTTLRLITGWNLVGFTSFIGPYTYGDLKAALPSGCILEAYEGTETPYYLKTITYDSFALSAGNGYWIYVGSDANWQVSN